MKQQKKQFEYDKHDHVLLLKIPYELYLYHLECSWERYEWDAIPLKSLLWAMKLLLWLSVEFCPWSCNELFQKKSKYRIIMQSGY